MLYQTSVLRVLTKVLFLTFCQQCFVHTYGLLTLKVPLKQTTKFMSKISVNLVQPYHIENSKNRV